MLLLWTLVAPLLPLFGLNPWFFLSPKDGKA